MRGERQLESAARHERESEVSAGPILVETKGPRTRLPQGLPPAHEKLRDPELLLEGANLQPQVHGVELSASVQLGSALFALRVPACEHPQLRQGGRFSTETKLEPWSKSGQHADREAGPGRELQSPGRARSRCIGRELDRRRSFAAGCFRIALGPRIRSLVRPSFASAARWK